MDQIIVPQFLDVEDKIIGPITVRQFIELMIAGLIIFIFYKIFDFSLFAVSGLLVLGITLIVAFVRINGQPFHYFLLNFFATLKSPKLKVWRKQYSDNELIRIRDDQEIKKNLPKTIVRKPVTSSRLSELSLIVDTGGVYRGEEDSNNIF
jgi:hypothetical protein